MPEIKIVTEDSPKPGINWKTVKVTAWAVCALIFAVQVYFGFIFKPDLIPPSLLGSRAIPAEVRARAEYKADLALAKQAVEAARKEADQARAAVALAVTEANQAAEVAADQAGQAEQADQAATEDGGLISMTLARDSWRDAAEGYRIEAVRWRGVAEAAETERVKLEDLVGTWQARSKLAEERVAKVSRRRFRIQPGAFAGFGFSPTAGSWYPTAGVGLVVTFGR